MLPASAPPVTQVPYPFTKVTLKGLNTSHSSTSLLQNWAPFTLQPPPTAPWCISAQSPRDGERTSVLKEDGYLRRMISEAPLLYMRKPPLLFFRTVLMDLRTELKV